jgi:hypothetical protein
MLNLKSVKDEVEASDTVVAVKAVMAEVCCIIVKKK